MLGIHCSPRPDTLVVVENLDEVSSLVTKLLGFQEQKGKTTFGLSKDPHIDACNNLRLNLTGSGSTPNKVANKICDLLTLFTLIDARKEDFPMFKRDDTGGAAK